ncbi:MAG TPA: lycopene cyclase domain-containing protein [Actinotalea sp.]|nr:lycopene cyclase domain-containing protein [Actinotalea sp.]
MTYLLVSLPFVAAAVGVLVVARRRSRRAGGPGMPDLAAVGAALGVLLVLTAVFDNLMISVGLVDYSADRILGLRLGVAPVEDFTYPVAGALLLPALWHLLGGRVEAPSSAGPRDAGDTRPPAVPTPEEAM